MAILAQDSFTDANGTLITVHTPEIGGTWTYFKGTGAQPSISSNRLSFVSSGRSYYLSAVTARDVYVQVDRISGIQSTVLYTRVQDTNNFYTVGILNTQLALTRKLAGTEVELASKVYSSTVNTLKLIVSGDSITAVVNGNVELSTIDNTFTTAGYVALGGNTLSTVVDNFEAGDAPVVSNSVALGSGGSSMSCRNAIYDFNRRINNDGTW